MQVQPIAVREATPVTGTGEGKVPAMGGGGGTNYQSRKILNRQNADSLKIVYDIPKSHFTPGCCSKICGCTGGAICKCKRMEEVNAAKLESTYTWVMENRVEFSRPVITPKNEMCAPCCCKYRVMDNTNTVHFDDDMYDYIGVKGPPNCLVTMLCGTPGDRVTFKRVIPGCPSPKLCSVEVASVYVTKGDGAKTVEIITQARDSARAQMK